MIEITMIDVLAIETRIKMSAMLAMIATRIARAITIVITRIASTIETIAIERTIALIERSMTRQRATTPCTSMLAAARAALAREVFHPPRACRDAPPPLHPAPAAGPGLVKTTTSPTKDTTVVFHPARGLIPTLRKTSTVQPMTAAFLPPFCLLVPPRAKPRRTYPAKPNTKPSAMPEWLRQ
mgnify:CR=1 FL=1